MDHLWSPWRLRYVTGNKPADNKAADECVFCRAARPPAIGGSVTPSADVDSLVVFQGVQSYVILNRYPYNNGHLMVVINRHVPSLQAATNDELAEVMQLTKHAEIALSDGYRPHGINVGINLGRPAGAGVVDHLHVHLVPRWNGDTSFISIVGNVRVLPEELGQTAGRLRPIFERLSAEDA